MSDAPRDSTAELTETSAAPLGFRTSSSSSRCDVLRPVAFGVPLPLLLVVLAHDSPWLPIVGVVALLMTAVIAALTARRCADRRYRNEAAQHERELAHTKRQILSLVSHELRTPVTGVVGFSRTLAGRLDDLDHDTLRLFVDAIDEHSNRLSRLIDNVVVASRTPLVTDGGTCQLSRALSEAIARVGGTSPHDDRLRIELASSVTIRIDHQAAVRVLTNLLDNALKFGDPDERILVEGGLCDGWVQVQVGNAGPAIPMGLQTALYDPFVQGDPTDTRTADGLGLGLHVVRQLVEAYGGTISLVDHPRLIVFQVRLPAAGALVTAQRAAGAARRRDAATPTGPRARSGQELQDRGGDDVRVLEGHPMSGGRDHLHA